MRVTGGVECTIRVPLWLFHARVCVCVCVHACVSVYVCTRVYVGYYVDKSAGQPTDRVIHCPNQWEQGITVLWAV